ncbi:MAG: hypothetical protein ACKO38_11675 [Planctomycetota bacterium]
MNIDHLRTLIWLRWRLTANTFNRLEMSSKALRLFFAAWAVSISWSSFFLVVAFSNWLLPSVWNDVLLLTWNALVAGFVAFWLIGMLNELRQPEAISWDKCLYLPISAREAFLLNFGSSTLSLPNFLFVPPMAGLSLSMAIRYGGGFWGGLLLVPCFVLMSTAGAFHLRSWLALILKNQRRRRLAATAAGVFIAISFQLPGLLHEATQENLPIAGNRNDQRAAAQEAFVRNVSQIDRFVPPLWLAAGWESIGRGSGWGGLAAGTGMLALTGFSLVRSYRLMLNQYRGESVGGAVGRPQSKARTPPESSETPVAFRGPEAGRRNWLEFELPWLNRPQSAMAMMTWRCLARTPELQVACFMPILMLVLGFGLAAWRAKGIFPDWSHPLIAVALCYLGMSGPLQLILNQFGFDRHGFRSVILSPAGEFDILFGRGFAIAVLSIVTALPVLIASHCIWRLQPSHLAATVSQIGCIVLSGCLCGNITAIFGPIGAMSKSAQVRIGPVLLSMTAMSVSVMPLLPSIAMLGIEWVVKDTGWLASVPFYLIGSVTTFAVLVVVHRPMIRWQGTLLRRQRLRILETVTKTDG